MTTPPETPDPFASPTPTQSAPQPPMAPPGYAPIAPPGYAPMAPPGYAAGGYAPITVAPSGSNKVAVWAIVLTGAYAATSVLGAVMAPGTVDGLKEQLSNPDTASPFAGQSPASFLSFPVAIASFVLLALWMSKMRAARTNRGEVVGGPPAVEWWGWFVPLGNIVLPFLGMRAITKARVGMGMLFGWWLAYLAAGAISVAAVIPEFTAIDLSTGELTDPNALDAIVGLQWGSAIAMVVSWVFLAMIIRVTTRRQEELS